MNNSKKISIPKILYFLAGLAVIISVTVFIINNSKLSAHTKAPKIVFDDYEHDFGKVPQGPQLQYNFKFTNKGNALLVIDHIQTSCGCTGATMGDKKEYKKNESGEIAITFNTQGREGYQEKFVTIFSNDPENQQVQLKVSCEVDPNLTY